jgi:predicted nucleotidyltransferase
VLRLLEHGRSTRQIADELHLTTETVRNRVRNVSIFGSALTERFKESSDIDILVEFEPEYRVGYLRMAAMERELSALFGGRPVDLRTAPELSRASESTSIASTRPALY